MKNPECFGKLYTEKPLSVSESCVNCALVEECKKVKLNECFGKLVNSTPECDYCSRKLDCLKKFTENNFDDIETEIETEKVKHNILKIRKSESQMSKMVELLKVGKHDKDTLYKEFWQRHTASAWKKYESMLYAVSLVTDIIKDDNSGHLSI